MNGRSVSRTMSVLFLFLCILLLSVGLRSPGAQSAAQREGFPEVRNETEALQIISMKKRDDLLVLRLKNVSNKTITAYRLDFGHGSRGGRDFILADKETFLFPGRIEEHSIPLSNFDPPDPPGPSASDKTVLTVLVAVFDDGSSEGDYNAANWILTHRLGQKIQLKRIRQLLRDSLKYKDQEFSASFYRLKSQVDSLPTEIEKGQSFALKVGLSYTKQRIIRHINEIERWHNTGEAIFSHGIHDSTSLRDALTKLKRMCEEQLAKL